MDFEQAIRQLQDSLVVTAGIQSRHERFIKDHDEWLEDHARVLASHQKFLQEHALTRAEHERWMVEMQNLLRDGAAAHDRRMLEIEEKLNALIDIVDGMQRRPGHPPETKQ